MLTNPSRVISPARPDGLHLSDLDAEHLRSAMIELVIEHGPEALTVGRLCRAGGISREDFDREFGSLEDAYVWVHGQYISELKAAISAAFEGQSGWRDALRAAAYAATRWIEANPRAIRFSMIDSPGAGERADLAREEALEWMVDLIDSGRRELPDPESKQRGLAVGAIGAAYNQLAAEIRERGGDLRSSRFVADWMYLAVLPYFGHRAAQEELGRKAADLERYRRGQI